MNTQKKSPQTNTYLAYLVRFWRESETEPWRITVQHIHTGEQSHFARLIDYLDFLQLETEST